MAQPQEHSIIYTYIHICAGSFMMYDLNNLLFPHLILFVMHNILPSDMPSSPGLQN